jgi:spermidine synthase
MLSLIFGHTTFAISTVITAFMGGLALGSYFLGRWADSEGKIKNFFRKIGGSPDFLMYGFLEVFIGIYCLFTPKLFNIIEFIYLQFSDLPFYTISIIRFILCIVVLVIPTFCMGGTLPLLSKFLIINSQELSKKLGFLYFINTAGAVLGTILAGFYLISTLGVTGTLHIAAFINIAIGILVYGLNRASGKDISGIEEKETKEEYRQEKTDKIAWLIFIIFGFTGFGSMIYELAWTRAISLALGSSTYAFSTMLATFLFGIALGSIIYSFLSKRKDFTISSFGWFEVMISLACLITIPLLGRIPLYVIYFFPILNNSYDLILLANFFFCFAVMLIPTTIMGFVFPLVGKLYTQNIKKIGRHIGDIYAINTLGCILGSFLTGFILIPFIGVQNSLKIGVLINMIAGVVLLYTCSKKLITRLSYISGLILFIVLLNYIPSWNPTIMSSGSAIYADIYKEEYGKARTEGKKYFDELMIKYLVFQKDGISCTVSVYDFGSAITLRVNGKTDASTAIDMPTQLLLGYMPVLYHKNPQDLFIIGLGSGVTCKAVLDLPEVKSAVCVEIEPAVVEAARYFKDFNGNVLANPKLNVNIDDGRNAMLASQKNYDVIISAPSNPWISGIGNLFTTDFYRICKSKLKEDGIMAQWVQLTKMNQKDIDMIINTFYTAFPEGIIWQGKDTDLLLLGSQKPLVFDYERFKDLYEHNESFRISMISIGINKPDVIFSHYITRPDDIDYSSTLFNTDDMPLLEFSAPKSLYMESSDKNLRYIYQYKLSALPPLKDDEKIELSDDYYIKMFDFYNRHMPDVAQKFFEKHSDKLPGILKDKKN